MAYTDTYLLTLSTKKLKEIREFVNVEIKRRKPLNPILILEQKEKCGDLSSVKYSILCYSNRVDVICNIIVERELSLCTYGSRILKGKSNEKLKREAKKEAASLALAALMAQKADKSRLRNTKLNKLTKGEWILKPKLDNFDESSDELDYDYEDEYGNPSKPPKRTPEEEKALKKKLDDDLDGIADGIAKFYEKN